MKKIPVEQFSQQALALVEIAQRERVIVTRKGKPVAVLVGIENKDQEDLALEGDEAFWRMIHERRKEKTTPLAEVKKRYGLDGKKAGKKKAT